MQKCWNFPPSGMRKFSSRPFYRYSSSGRCAWFRETACTLSRKSFLIFSFALQRQIYLFLAGICQKLIRLLLLKFWRNCFVFFDDGWLAGWSGGRVWLSLSSLEHTTEQTMMMMMGKGDLVLTFCSVEKTGLLLLLILFRPRLDLLWTGFPHTLERRRKWLLSWCPLFLPAALEQKMRKIYFFCNRFDWPFVCTFCKQLFCLPLIHSVVLKHWRNVFFWPIFWRNGPFQAMFWLYFLIFKASFQQKQLLDSNPGPLWQLCHNPGPRWQNI